MAYSQAIYAHYIDLGTDANIAEEEAQENYYEYRQDGGVLSIEKWFFDDELEDNSSCTYLQVLKQDPEHTFNQISLCHQAIAEYYLEDTALAKHRCELILLPSDCIDNNEQLTDSQIDWLMRLSLRELKEWYLCH